MPTATLPTSGGPVTVDAIEPVPGLYVYEVPESVHPTSRYRWILAHHEGRALASFETEEAATGGANGVAHLADWTRSQMTTANQISLGGFVWKFTDLLRDAGGVHPNS